MAEQNFILVNEQGNIILDTALLEPPTLMANGPIFCKVYEDVLVRAALARFPGIMEMLQFAAGKVETAANAVEKEIAEYETRIAKTFDGLRFVNDEYRALTDSRDRLTQASAKHARTLGEYRRLKAIMEPQDSMANPEAQ